MVTLYKDDGYQLAIQIQIKETGSKFGFGLFISLSHDLTWIFLSFGFHSHRQLHCSYFWHKTLADGEKKVCYNCLKCTGYKITLLYIVSLNKRREVKIYFWYPNCCVYHSNNIIFYYACNSFNALKPQWVTGPEIVVQKNNKTRIFFWESKTGSQ